MPTNKRKEAAQSAAKVKTSTKAKAAKKPVKAVQKPTAKKPAPPCDCTKCKKANGGKCPDAIPAKKATAKKGK